MSTVTYNGVTLEICRQNQFEMRPVKTKDGVDTLYTHFVGEWQCVWNPSATASNKVGNPLVGDLPAVSLGNLRTILLQPRGHLVVRIGSDILLQSPQEFVDDEGGLSSYETDANNGPQPISCNVIAWHGIRSAIVIYRIETWLYECPGTRALIAHRWEMTHELDEHYYTRRIIRGEAVFRTDILLNNVAPDGTPAVPDDFRIGLFHPVPAGMQRKKVDVNVSSDGTSASYTAVDEQQTLVIMADTGVTKVNAKVWRDMNIQGIPVIQVGIHIQIWGDARITRQRIVDWLQQCAASWGFLQPGQAQRPGSRSNLVIDAVNHYGELTISVLIGVNSVAAGVGALFFWNLNPGLGDFTWKEPLGEVAGNLDAALGLPAFNRPNGTAPIVGGVRNDQAGLGRLITQAITGSCGSPGGPFDPGTGNTATLATP